MGTIAAVVPIALGVSDAAGLDRALVVGAVIGGAMFGDNLSVISDTTIAATRSQGCEMRDKFRENFKIALPAAIATAVLLGLLGDAAPVSAPDAASKWLVLPYLAVLVLALSRAQRDRGAGHRHRAGRGVRLRAVAGLRRGRRSPATSTAAYESMVEITLLSLLIGGLGGADQGRAAACSGWPTRSPVSPAATPGAAPVNSASRRCSALGDAFTANNTVAILVGGSVAQGHRRRATTSRPQRAASLLDIFACAVQGVLPYGAQILLAGSLAAAVAAGAGRQGLLLLDPGRRRDRLHAVADARASVSFQVARLPGATLVERLEPQDFPRLPVAAKAAAEAAPHDSGP